MRLIQLLPEAHVGPPLDLHPLVTVVNGLTPAARERLINAVTALPRGGDPGCGGLVEAHGVLFDLSPATLSLLDLDGELDVLVRPSDIPGVVTPVDVATSRLSAEQYLAVTSEGVEPELDRARNRRRDAREALTVLREAAERARRELIDATARRERAAAAVDALNGEGDEAEEAVDVELDDAAELDEHISELEAELARIDRGIDELAAIDTRPIHVLLDAIRDPAPVEYGPSERANELADEFVALQARVAAFEDAMEAEGDGPVTAMRRLDEARDALHHAERVLAKPDLSESDVAELEAAHEAVLEAEKRVSGMRRKGAQRRLDEAVARQQQVLDRVGFPTWSAYVMGASLLAIDPMAERAVEQARFELEAAEAHWAEISALIEANPDHRAVLDQLEALYLEAFDLLDGREPDDLPAALRELQVPKREVTTDELVDALAYQLSLVGLDLGDSPGTDRTLVAAEAFLEEAGAIGGRLDELQAERRDLETRLADAHARRDRRDGATIDLTDDAPETSELDASEVEAELEAARLDEAEAADTVEAREALVDAATQIEAVATARLMRIAADLAAASPRLDESRRPSSEPAFDVDDLPAAGRESIEFYLLARLAALRNVSFAGSVPLVIDDALGSVPPADVRELLAKLERMSEAVQIIYLTDDATVTDWAYEVGLDRAAVVDTPPAFA